jgi:hypothetical protein
VIAAAAEPQSRIAHDSLIACLAWIDVNGRPPCAYASPDEAVLPDSKNRRHAWQNKPSGTHKMRAGDAPELHAISFFLMVSDPRESSLQLVA